MTSDAIRRAADLLRGHRESIDRLDAILVFTLAERFKHTQAVGVLKAAARPAAVRPGARDACRSPGSSGWPRRPTSIPAFARKFLNFIISEVIRHHERHLENGLAAHPEPKETDQWP